MDPESKTFLDRGGQATHPQVRVGGQQGVAIRQDHVGQLVGPPRTRFGRHQRGDPAGGPGGLRLVKRRAREPKPLRGRGDRHPVLRHPAEHLVLDLHHIPGVEERGVLLKQGVGDPVGVGMAGVRLAQPGLLVVGQCGLPPPLEVLIRLYRQERPCQASPAESMLRCYFHITVSPMGFGAESIAAAPA